MEPVSVPAKITYSSLSGVVVVGTVVRAVVVVVGFGAGVRDKPRGLRPRELSGRLSSCLGWVEEDVEEGAL